MTRIDGLPIVPDTALPADVRRGSAADKQAYSQALGFEQILDRQLVQAMAGSDAAAPGGSDDDASGDGGVLGGGDWGSTVQDAMAQALTAGGGLGLARTLYEQLRPETSR